MESKNLLTLAITLTVGIILAGSLLMPVISDATETERTLENIGYYSMNELNASDDTEHTLTWASSNKNILAVDGKDIEISSFDAVGASLTIFASETDLLRIGISSSTGSPGLSWIQMRGSTVAYASANTTFTATISSGSVAAVMDGTSKSLSYTSAYLITAEDGDYVMKKANETAYMFEDSTIYSLGYTTISNGDTSLNAVFKVDGDLSEVEVSSLTSDLVTFSDVVINSTLDGKYVGVSKFSSVSFTATAGGSDTDCIYSYVIVPHYITAELSQHLDQGEIAIMNALPVLIIAALVVMAAGALYLKRND